MTGILVPQHSRHNDYSHSKQSNGLGPKRIAGDLVLSLAVGTAITAGMFFTGKFFNPGDMLQIGMSTVLIASCLFAYRRWQDQMTLLGMLNETVRNDSLTGILNRNSMDTELEKELSRARRYQSHTSVLMIDIDHFKTINDLYGHKTGDRVIQQVVKCITDSIRVSDTLGRYGGEEFMVVLPQTTQDEASVVAERIRTKVLDTPLEEDGEQIVSSISIGVAEYNPTVDTADKLIDHSDQALYCAKHAGRNQVQCWTMH